MLPAQWASMEVRGHCRIGICASRLNAVPNPENPYRISHSRRFRGAGCANRRPDSVSCSASKWADRLLPDFQFFSPAITSDTSDDQQSADTATLTNLPPLPLVPPERRISVPIDFYRVLGAERHFLGDGIKRAYEARVSRLPQSGYSQDALISRRQILQAACETLANPRSRREYNRGFAEDEERTILTEVPWDKVPGALCVLQEAGEAQTVLQIGDNLLRERLPKSFKQDIVLAMGLAYVDISRNAMAVAPPDFIEGCEALERALKLLQEEGASSLAPDLQSQIDETLEDITPRCILELLALPLEGEFRKRREEGLQGVRNILWAVGGGGAVAIPGKFTREGFMNVAFTQMTAVEQVDLFAATPSNIPAESFEVYGVALALVAQAIVGKKPYLIKDADSLFQQLQQTKVTAPRNGVSYTVRENREVDFALERGLCSLLVGDVDVCRTWLGLDGENSAFRDPSIVNFVLENSKDDKENKLLCGLCKLLEAWLMEVVFPRFRETKGLQFKLGDYYDDPTVLQYLERLEGMGGSPLAVAAAIVRIGTGATAVLDNVKASVIQALQKAFPVSHETENVKSEVHGETNQSAAIVCEEGSLEKSGNNGVDRTETFGTSSPEQLSDPDLITQKMKNASVRIMCAGVVAGLVTLIGLKYFPKRIGFLPARKAVSLSQASDLISMEPAIGEITEEIPRMDAKYAEGLVRKWQDIKSVALGPDHCLGKLSEVLDGQMLKVWMDRASEIAQRGWFWDYTLISLTINNVTLSLAGQRAVVEATLEESASLVDIACPEHNDSYNTAYTMRYEMTHTGSGGWKITEGAVLRSLNSSRHTGFPSFDFLVQGLR